MRKKNNNPELRVSKRGRVNEGRPPVIDDFAEQVLKEEFENDASVEFACEAAGVSPSAFYTKCRENEEFRKRMTRAQNKPLRDAQNTVMKQIRGTAKKAGDGQLGLRFLERRMPKRYKTQVEMKDITPPPKNVVIGNQKPHPMFRTPEQGPPPSKAKAKPKGKK